MTERDLKEEDIIGIDLGTSNSAVSCWKNGKEQIIVNSEGKNTTNSVVSFTDDGTLTGQAANSQRMINPENTIFEFKRLIGRKFDDPEIQKLTKIVPFKIIPSKNGDAWVEVTIKGKKKEYSPQQLSAFVLQKMKQTAEKVVGHVKKAIITVPAYFNDSQRQATKDAGEIAGLDVVRIINEPTAAALHYGYGRDDKAKKTILVFDLGGGTYDVSIVELNKGIFEVKATNGDAYLGGANYDQIVVNQFIKEFKVKNPNIDLEKDKSALQRLKEEGQEAKERLSFSEQTDINLPFLSADATGPKHFVSKLSRQELNKLVKDLNEKLIPPLKKCLEDAKLAKEKIDEVILVGGMTRMPSVKEKVKEFFGKEPKESVHPDEAVSLGAAIQGAVLSGKKMKGEGVLLLDVTPLSLGIETLNGIFARLINRNTTIPTRQSQIFSTAENNQSKVDIRVFQGEREFTKDNKFLGTFQLEGIKPAPRGIPQIEVTFDIDANGIVKVSAKDKTDPKNEREQSIKIDNAQGLSKEEKEKAIHEAEENEQKDKEERENVEKLNQAQNYLYNFEEQVENFKKNEAIKEDDPELQAFQEKTNDLKKVVEARDYPKIKEKLKKDIEELINLAQKLQQKSSKKEEGEKDEKVEDIETEKKDKE